MLKSGYIFVLAALFVGVVFFLKAVQFWSLVGLSEPAGYLWQGGLFLVLLLVLQTGLFHPYLRTLEAREDQTIYKTRKALAVREDARQLASRYQTQIEEAKVRSLREREHIALRAEQEEKDRLAQAKKESQSSLKEALAALQGENESAKEQLKSFQESLVREIFAQTLGKPRAGAAGARSETVAMEAGKGT